MDAALRRAGIKSRGAAPPSAVSPLFGGDSSKAERDSTTDANNARRAVVAACFRVSSRRVSRPGRAMALVDSLINRPTCARRCRAASICVGARQSDRAARAPIARCTPVESRPIITGEELVKATARRDP